MGLKLGEKVSSFFFEYDTPRMVLVKNKKVGLVFRLIQLVVLGYIIGWVFLYEKGYQSQDGIISSVSVKLKGLTITNISGIGPHIWDVADYVFPPQGDSSFVVMTNVIITRGQKQDICPELPDAGQCNNDSDCIQGKYSRQGQGIMTGKCVDFNSSNKTCEIFGWCPVEEDNQIPEALISSILDQAITNQWPSPQGTASKGQITVVVEFALIAPQEINVTLIVPKVHGCLTHFNTIYCWFSVRVLGGVAACDIQGFRLDDLVGFLKSLSFIELLKFPRSHICLTPYQQPRNFHHILTMCIWLGNSVECLAEVIYNVHARTAYLIQQQVPSPPPFPHPQAGSHNLPIWILVCLSGWGCHGYRASCKFVLFPVSLSASFEVFCLYHNSSTFRPSLGYSTLWINHSYPAGSTELSPPLLLEAENFTLFIKNSITFPKFKVSRRNLVEGITTSYLKKCTYHKNKDPFCPVFELGYIVKESGQNFHALALQGGVVGITIDWDCDLDWPVTYCKPVYQFHGLYNDDNNVSSGFNFRYAKYYRENGTDYRTLYKVFGIRFDILVNGKAGKFDIIPTMTTIGSGIGIFGVASVVCDLLLLHFLPRRDYYKQRKFKYAEMRTPMSEKEEASPSSMSNLQNNVMGSQ